MTAAAGLGVLATLPRPDVAGRAGRLRARLGDAGCDALLVTAPANVRYLTGFTGSAGTVLVLPDRMVVATDGRYRTQVAEELAAARVEAEVAVGGVAAQQEVLGRALPAGTRLGLEAEHVAWAEHGRLARAWPGVALVATAGLVEGLRRVKDEGEQARIEAAAAVADAALAAVLPLLGRRPTEAEVALALDTEVRRLGADGPAFPTIVAAGPNGAKPHARPSARPVERGDLVVLDFGACVDGYRSDMTRTVAVGGPPTGVLADVAAVVAEAQAAGVAAVRAGVAAADVDRACRSVIEAAGFADAFVHGTGHGVGLDVHEAPAVAATSPDTLAAGDVVTVEPGVYLPDHGGVRIEDSVVVTEGGCRVLTRAPKDLVVAREER
jgi:Xaa-Pro aminopeptidase